MPTAQSTTKPAKTIAWKDRAARYSRLIGFLCFIGLLVNAHEAVDRWRFTNEPLSNLANAVRAGMVKNLKVSDREIRAYYANGQKIRIAKEPSVSLAETLRPYNLNGSLEKIEIDYSGTPSWVSFMKWLCIVLLGWYTILRPIIKSIDEAIEKSPSGPFGKMKNRRKETGLTTTLADVAGSVPVKEELREVVDFLKNPARYQQIGARIPRGILLSGPPGTGKTLLARAVAGEAAASFFLMNASEFVELLAGMGAKRVRELFEQAREAVPAIIFIDEIDAIAGRRGTNDSDERLQTLNQLLVEMDGFNAEHNVIVMAATNRLGALDSAILRPGRFDRRINVPLPTREEREEILKLRAKSRTLASDVALGRVAERTTGFSGADLEAVLNEAALLAARTNATAINQAGLLEAIDKLELGLKHHRPPTPEERRRTAIHEAGHAIVAFKHAGERVQRISLVARGEAGGFTRSSLGDSDSHTMTEQMLKNRLAVLMGGHAAEKIEYPAGEVSTGLTSDLKQATTLAYAMVNRFGMGPKTGLITVVSRASGTIRHQADEDVRTLIAAGAMSATETIQKNKEAFDQLVKMLLEREALEEEEIRALLASKA